MNNKQQNIDNMKDAFNSIDGTEVNSSYNDNELTLEEVEILFRKKCLEFQQEHQKKQPDKDRLNTLNGELTFLKQKINLMDVGKKQKS